MNIFCLFVFGFVCVHVRENGDDSICSLLRKRRVAEACFVTCIACLFFKMSKLLEEKQDHIDVLQERVGTLEQRLHDHSLSGDDRVTAIMAEVKSFCRCTLPT